MRKINYTAIILIIALSVFIFYSINEIKTYRIKLVNLQNTTNALDAEMTHWKQNYLTNTDYLDVGLKDYSLLGESSSVNITDLLQNNQFILVLFYSSELCSICDYDLYEAMKGYEKSELYEKLYVFVPINNYREFININQQNDLNIKNIFAYESPIEEFAFNTGRGVFMLIDDNLKVRNLFIPSKPINEDWLSGYFNTIASKILEIDDVYLCRNNFIIKLIKYLNTEGVKKLVKCLF
jgi:hypothetical protein